MKISAISDVGLVREVNEDCYAVAECCGGILSVLCDGMGGHAAGEVASKMASDSISAYLAEKITSDMSDEAFEKLFNAAIQKANEEIYACGLVNEKFKGMGTTLVITFVRDNTLYLGHVGDSRCYLVRGNALILLTKDHSLMQEMLDKGEISEEETDSFPFKNVITRCLGTPNSVVQDFSVYELESNDIIISCSDGLTNYCSNQDIIDTVISSQFDECAENLVEKAKAGGGGDNVTVVITAIN